MTSFDKVWLDEAPSDVLVCSAEPFDPIPVAERAKVLILCGLDDWRGGLLRALAEQMARVGIDLVMNSEQERIEYGTPIKISAYPLGPFPFKIATIDAHSCGKGKKGHRKIVGRRGSGGRWSNKE